MMKNYLEKVPFIYSFFNDDNYISPAGPQDLSPPDPAFREQLNLPGALEDVFRDALDLSSGFITASDEDAGNLSSRSSDISYGDSVELSSADLTYRDPCSSLDSDHEIVRDGREVDPESKLSIYTLNEVSYHDSFDDCWIILYDRVYDITTFLLEHPGGEDVLMENAGRDATISFRSVGHSRAALKALEEYLIGILPDEQRMFPADSQSRWSIL